MTIVDKVRQLSAELAAEVRCLTSATWKYPRGDRRPAGCSAVPLGWRAASVGGVPRRALYIARVAPSAGWASGVIGPHPWQSALFPEETQHYLREEDASRMLSSSYAPTGKVVPADGSYRVSGRRSFSSGCDHAHGLILGGVAVEQAKGTPLPS